MKNGIIFGAGNIGRGFIGQLLSESGYQLTLVDVDEELLRALNKQGSYCIELVDNEQVETVTVGPVQALHSTRDQEMVIQSICQASLGATAVGSRVLPYIAPLIAMGMQRRLERGILEPLNLIICENLKGAAGILRGMIEEHLPSELKIYTHTHLGLVDTVIGRMVPPPTSEMRQQDPGLIRVEPYKELPVDRLGFIGEPPQVVGMEAITNFPAYTARKLYIHNCGHACLAYLGYLQGYEYGYQALADLEVLSQVRQALTEAQAGIVHHYGVRADWLQAHIDDLLHRFANRALGDTTFRLGRDPLRKLDQYDRLVGAARLAEEAGLNPVGIARGIAAGYCFAAKDDPLAVELQQKIASQGFTAILEEVSGIKPAEPLAALINSFYLGFKQSG